MFEIRRYINEEGASITGKYPVAEDGSIKILSTPEFSGVVGLPTPQGNHPIYFDFPETWSLKKCFDNFEEVAALEVERIVNEAQKQAAEDNLIVTPNGAPTGPNMKLMS